MGSYMEVLEVFSNASTVMSFFVVLAGLLVLFLGIGQAVKLWRELRRPKENQKDGYEQHVKDANDRFEKGERHIEQNHQDILDLKEGLRASCVANMALLNHAIHNGNTDEMIKAASGLNDYLINRK